MPMSNYEITLKNFEEYVTTGDYNTVAKTLDTPQAQGFLCELLTEYASFFLKIRLDGALGFAMVDVYPGITIPPWDYPAAAQYIAEKNAEKKVGSLQICPQHGDLYYHVESSFLSSPLTGIDLMAMEDIAVSSLLSCREDLFRMGQAR